LRRRERVVPGQGRRVAHDQTIQLIPIERPRAFRTDEMTASRTSQLRPNVAQIQEQHADCCSRPRQVLDRSCPHLFIHRTAIVSAGEPDRSGFRRSGGTTRSANRELAHHKIYARNVGLQAGLLNRCIPDHSIDRARSFHRRRCNLLVRKARGTGLRLTIGPASQGGYRTLPDPEASVQCPAGALP
jgi:hypothetical protein